MGVVSTISIISFVSLALVVTTDGESMTLSSSYATVGQPLTLQCVYIGTYSPATLNFYVGSDIIGLQIELPACSYASSTGYDITLYDKICGVKAVNLTIKNVTTGDIGKTWQCDATFLVGPLVAPSKASTTIVKGDSSTNPGSSTGLSTGAIVGIVIAVVVFLLVHAILIWLIIKYCYHGLNKGVLIGLVIASIVFVAVEVPLIYFIIQYCCNQNHDSSQKGGKSGTENKMEKTEKSKTDKKIHSSENSRKPADGPGKENQ